MSRILRRPMFRGGSTSNEGIMSVPRKGYADIDEEGVQPGYEEYDQDYGQNVQTINPLLIKKEVGEIKNNKKTYKALGQEIEEGSYGDALLKEYLGNRSDPLGKFLINFGLNYMSARPRGGKFGALATAADAAKKPTEQLYADQDNDRLLKLKLMGSLSKSESKVALEKEANLLVQEGIYKTKGEALSALLKARLEKKETSVQDKINEEYKSLRGKALSKEGAIKDKNIAEILHRDSAKLGEEKNKLSSTNTFGIPDNITKLPNSTDYTIPNAKKLDLDSFKVGRIYVDADSRMSFEYMGNNIFRPKIKL
jgi:hypothetical protein